MILNLGKPPVIQYSQSGGIYPNHGSTVPNSPGQTGKVVYSCGFSVVDTPCPGVDYSLDGRETNTRRFRGLDTHYLKTTNI